jgi:cell division protease FtsH
LNTRFLRNGVVTLVLVVGTALLLYMVLFNNGNPNRIQFSGQPDSFISELSAGNVQKVIEQGDQLQIYLKSAADEAHPLIKTTNFNPAVTDVAQVIAATCAQPGAQCKADQIPFAVVPADDSGAWVGLLLSALLPVLLIGVFLYFMFRQAQGTNNQALSFGKSRARMFLGNKTVVTFQDVAGVDEAKMELQEVVEFLKYPE